jgi:ABC-2 type transport system ATP-binding protein
MIDVRHLAKWYGAHPAVRDVTFGVEAGEVVGFLGPNGAGKSTTLRVLCGFLGATAGEVRIAGHDPSVDPIAVRRSIGYMPETCPLYPEMRVVEYLRFRAELKEVRRGQRAAAVQRAIEDAGLDEVAGRPIAALSKGFRQRVGLADALVASPPLLVLDEPTAGLDPNQIREVRALVGRLRERHTILLSTHILSEVEAVCSRGVVIARGEVVASGTLDELRALRTSTTLVARVGGKPKAARAATRALASVPGVAATAIADGSGDALEITLEAGANADEVAERVVAALVAAGLGVREVRPARATLEDVFEQVTAAPVTDGEAPPS